MMSISQKIFTIFACGLIFSACTSAKPNESQNNNLPKTQEESGLKGKYSLKSLLVQNKNLACTYKFTDEENKLEVTGKAYISGKKILQQTQTVNLEGEKKVIDGAVYTDGDYAYIWSPSDKNSAMKMKIENETTGEGMVKTDFASVQENMEKEYEIECLPWSVDEKVFSLPEDVIFKDFSEMMKGLPSTEGLPSMPQVPNIPKQ